MSYTCYDCAFLDNLLDITSVCTSLAQKGSKACVG